MITYKMHLLRTGSTWNGGERKYVGRQDPPLSDRGVAELCSLLDEYDYPRAEMVFTSPLRRCAQTAGILYPDTWTESMDGLADMHLGGFEGRTLEERGKDGDFTRWLENSLEHTPPGGEDPQASTLRIVGAAHDIFQRMMEERLTSAAVITHGGVIMSLLSSICLPRRPMHEWAAGNGCGYTLLFTPQMWMRDGCAEVYARLPASCGRSGDFDEFE